jgi:hypothetical protein
MMIRRATAVPVQILNSESPQTGTATAAGLETIAVSRGIGGGRVMSGGEARFVYQGNDILIYFFAVELSCAVCRPREEYQ